MGCDPSTFNIGRKKNLIPGHAKARDYFQSAWMTIEKFNQDLRQARLELSAATAAVMELVRSGKAFGDEWDAAVARERAAFQKMHWVLDSPLAPRGDKKSDP
ncbi:MAG: hypothetical protein ABWY46_23580 [Pseudomonas sp.]